MSRFDKAHVISHYCSIVTVTLSCIVSYIARHWSKIAKFIYLICIQHPRPIGGGGVTPSEFREDVS